MKKYKKKIVKSICTLSILWSTNKGLIGSVLRLMRGSGGCDRLVILWPSKRRVESKIVKSSKGENESGGIDLKRGRRGVAWRQCQLTTACRLASPLVPASPCIFIASFHRAVLADASPISMGFNILKHFSLFVSFHIRPPIFIPYNLRLPLLTDTTYCNII